MNKHFLVLGLAGLAGMTTLYTCTEPLAVKKQDQYQETPESTAKKTVPVYSRNNQPISPQRHSASKEPITRKGSKPDNSFPETAQNPTPPFFPYSLPKPSPSEETVEEEEPFWYDLPAEKRNFKTSEEVGKYFNAALEARDYRVAESYLANFQKVMTPPEYEKLKNGFLYVITSDYNEFLTDIIDHCQKYDQDSVFRKVLWMNFFAAEHQEVFPIADPYTRKDLDLTTLLKKGEQALHEIEHCVEKKLNE